MTDHPTFSVTLEQRDRYRFDIVFDDPAWAPVQTDEPRPLGGGTAPNPVRLLGAAIGNCLAASLLFCLEKARVPVTDVRGRVRGTLARNERGRLRVDRVSVLLEPKVEGVPPERLGRCLELFEDFCIVTQSVREGFEVEVEVRTTTGTDTGRPPTFP